MDNPQPEFLYDSVGNMTADLDCDIVTIKYNLLNLPEIVQFKNGNQIRNKYDAAGQKLNSRYFTVDAGVYQPIIPGQIIENLDVNENDNVTVSGMDYIGNIEYQSVRLFDWDVTFEPVEYHNLSRIHNPEGYSTSATLSYGPIYHYYRKDHLGNNREVWRASYTRNSTTYAAATLQRTQYYPSGLPWKTLSGDNPATQPYKYNGKEFVEMHGLDEYDSEARWYYPAIMCKTTMDPLAEKYYEMSPYAWCGNNPVRNIDPDGRDVWELDNEGNIVNRIKDTTQDAFYMVEKDDKGNFQRTYTKDDKGNITSYNSITFEYGTIDSQQTISLSDDKSFDVYKVRGDDNGTALFEFMGKHVTVSSSKVEVSQAMTGIEGEKGLNFITTSHEERKESGMTHLLNKQLLYGYTIRELNHSHPNSDYAREDDFAFADAVIFNQNKNGYKIPKFHIYYVPGKSKNRYK